MKIGMVFFIMTSILALVGTLFGGAYSYSKNLDVLEQEVYEHLETAAQSRGSHINFLLEEQKEKLRILATHQDLSNEELREVNKINREFYEVFVMDAEGIIIASSDETKIGLDRVNDDYFIGGRKGPYIKDAYFSEDTKKNAIAVSVPFNEGVLVARIQLSILEEILLDKTGLGETGEIYLLNEEGYAITPLGKKEDTFLKFKVDSINSRDCFEDIEKYYNSETGEVEKHEENVQVYLDYLGEKVLGTHYHVAEKRWCLLAEINEDEILGIQKRAFQGTVLEIVIVLTLLIGFISYLVGRQLDKIFVYRKTKRKL